MPAEAHPFAKALSARSENSPCDPAGHASPVAADGYMIGQY